MELPGASEGSRVGSGQDAPVVALWAPQSWALTDKTQTCPKAVLCLCPLGEPPALLKTATIKDKAQTEVIQLWPSVKPRKHYISMHLLVLNIIYIKRNTRYWY